LIAVLGYGLALRYNSRRALLDAAELLERDGWCRGTPKGDGRHCVLGALGLAIRRTIEINDPCLVVLREVTGAKPPRGLVDWNDAPGRTQAEVVAALREAARRMLGDG
jgi:hypothetical protein